MTQKEKAEAYDEAIKVANKYKDTHIMFPLIKDEIFPELKENEDEKIRKTLIRILNENVGNGIEKYGAKLKDALAWLEKQGEQKTNPVLDIEIPFGAKDSELQEVSYYIPEGFHVEIDGNKVVIKKGEQKSVWSEEDKKYLRRAINATRNGYPETNNWLKSLKERYTWKPSDEQMKALRFVKGAKILDPEERESLNSLYIHLKKLKEK